MSLLFSFTLNKISNSHQLSYGLVVINVEFDRDDHGLISRNYDWEETETT
jgi:hypothetical protein